MASKSRVLSWACQSGLKRPRALREGESGRKEGGAADDPGSLGRGSKGWAPPAGSPPNPVDTCEAKEHHATDLDASHKAKIEESPRPTSLDLTLEATGTKSGCWADLSQAVLGQSP